MTDSTTSSFHLGTFLTAAGGVLLGLFATLRHPATVPPPTIPPPVVTATALPPGYTVTYNADGSATIDTGKKRPNGTKILLQAPRILPGGMADSNGVNLLGIASFHFKDGFLMWPISPTFYPDGNPDHRTAQCKNGGYYWDYLHPDYKGAGEATSGCVPLWKHPRTLVFATGWTLQPQSLNYVETGSSTSAGGGTPVSSKPCSFIGPPNLYGEGCAASADCTLNADGTANGAGCKAPGA